MEPHGELSSAQAIDIVDLIRKAEYIGHGLGAQEQGEFQPTYLQING